MHDMSKSEQIHVRLEAKDKETIEKAAKAERRSVSDFMVVAALEKAKKIRSGK